MLAWPCLRAVLPHVLKKPCDLQVIGVGAAVLGDMSSRPYWGLYELDFVFCTVIVSQPICAHAVL